MGQFTEGTIQIEAISTEAADKIADQIRKITTYLIEQGIHGDIDVNRVDVDDMVIDIDLSSNRQQNLEWQLEMIFKMCKDLFKGQMFSFTADYTIPENHIYQEWDEDGEEI